MRQSRFFTLDFVAWYYTRAFRDILNVWGNLMWFVVHFFSLPLLARTLFAPWKRMTDEYHRTGFEDIVETFVMNTLSHIFGALVRLLFIGVGVICMIFGILGLFVFIFMWVCMPVLSLISVVYGVVLLFL